MVGNSCMCIHELNNMLHSCMVTRISQPTCKFWSLALATLLLHNPNHTDEMGEPACLEFIMFLLYCIPSYIFHMHWHFLFLDTCLDFYFLYEKYGRT
jgi:hypothetical protein